MAIVSISHLTVKRGYLALLNAYDAIISDWMLPSKSGIELMQSLREKKITTPIIILSARGEIEDKVIVRKQVFHTREVAASKIFEYIEMF